MSEDRNDPIVRQGALLLSSLVLTPDEGLASYAERRVTLEGVTVDQLRAARDLLDAVGYALRSNSQDDWVKIEQALAVVRNVAPPATPASAASSDVNATGFLDASALQDTDGALPFQDAPAVAPAPVADQLPARTSNIDETSALGHKLDFSEAATPFEQAPPAAPDASPAAPEASPAAAPSAAPHAPPTLSLQQYASFCTERTRAGLTGSAAVAQRYGLADAAAVAAVDAHWGSQLANPAIKAQFDEHCQAYGDWLATQGR